MTDAQDRQRLRRENDALRELVNGQDLLIAALRQDLADLRSPDSRTTRFVTVQQSILPVQNREETAMHSVVQTLDGLMLDIVRLSHGEGPGSTHVINAVPRAR